MSNIEINNIYSEESSEDIYKKIIITTSEGSFEFSFMGNLDYYFYPTDSKITKFTILKSDGDLYNIFYQLFMDIKNYNIIDPNSFNSPTSEKKYSKELSSNVYKNFNNFEESLFKNDKIEWHSDEGVYEETSVLEIELNEENITINIIPGVVQGFFITKGVRLSKSGSRYSHFIYNFQYVYNELLKTCKKKTKKNKVRERSKKF